jgi:hypothetical protein
VTTYDTCQRKNGEIANIPGALKPLLILTLIWVHMAMDFIVGLLRVGKKYIIMVVVSNLSKYDHLCALPHPFTPSSISQVFLDHIFNLHSMPTSIVSDWNPTFTRKFWQ